MPGSERIASTWTDKHDTNRGIKRSPYPIWFPLHCASNLLVIFFFFKKGKGRDRLNASLCKTHERKASRGRCVSKHFEVSTPDLLSLKL